MASTLPMPTIISPEQSQPLTVISPSFHHLNVGPLHKHAGALRPCHADEPKWGRLLSRLFQSFSHLTPKKPLFFAAYCCFSVSRHSKVDQNKNQKRSIDKVQNLGNEWRYICKDPRQDSGQRNISYTRYPKKFFTQTYRDFYGDAMLVLKGMSSNMADGNQQKHLLPSFAAKAWIYFSKNS